MPEFWKEAILQVEVTKRITSILEHWSKFLYQFQSAISYLKVNLLDVELVIDNDQLALLYTIKT